MHHLYKPNQNQDMSQDLVSWNVFPVLTHCNITSPLIMVIYLFLIPI